MNKFAIPWSRRHWTKSGVTGNLRVRHLHASTTVVTGTPNSAAPSSPPEHALWPPHIRVPGEPVGLGRSQPRAGGRAAAATRVLPWAAPYLPSGESSAPGRARGRGLVFPYRPSVRSASIEISKNPTTLQELDFPNEIFLTVVRECKMESIAP